MPNLQQLNWSARNYNDLRLFLESQQDGLAVFDLDNTIYFGDIGDIFFYYQFLTSFWRPQLHDFSCLVPRQINGQNKVSVGEIKIDLLQIQEYCQKFSKNPEAYRPEFFIIFKAIKDQLENFSPAFAYSWMLSFLKGLSCSEISFFCEELIRKQLAKRDQHSEVQSDFFRLKLGFREGIAVYHEMLDLITALKERNFRVAIVSASHRQIVKSMLKALNLEVDHLIAMETGTENGVDSGRIVSWQPCNYGPGKVINIRNKIRREPLFVAGDSNGDYEMLTEFSATRLRLIINRGLTGKISSLYQRALNREEGFLLQNIDFAHACFVRE